MFRLRIVRRGRVAPLEDPPLPRQPVWRDDSGRVFAWGETRAGVHWLHMPGVASYRLSGPGLEVEACPDDGASDARVREAFLKTVVPITAHVRGWEVLHASAVRIRDGIVGFCGPSSSGKSTLAYAMARRGYEHWSDDALILDIGGEGTEALLLPFTVRLRKPSAEHFGAPATREPVESSGTDPASPAARETLTGLCVLDQTPRTGIEPDLERISSGAAFGAVFPHAFYFDVNDADRTRLMVRRHLRLVARVPVYRLRYGAGLDNLGIVLDAMERIRVA